MIPYLLLLCLIALSPVPVHGAPAPDDSFDQEVAAHHPLHDEDSNDVRAVSVDGDGTAWIASSAGIYFLERAGERWHWARSDAAKGPAFEAALDSNGKVWFGSWNGLYHTAPSKTLIKVPGMDSPVSVIAPIPSGGVYAFGPDGGWRVRDDGTVTGVSIAIAKGVKAALVHETALWIASSFDLYQYEIAEEEPLHLVETLRIGSDRESPAFAALCMDREGMLWAGGMGGACGYRDGVREVLLTPGKGLPHSDIRSLAISPSGNLWMGGALGVIRRSDDGWSLRHGRRWVLNDDARRICFGPDGSAWIATASGVSVVRTMPMSLEEKARHFLDICHARHVREPGLVEKCRLAKPGDTSKWHPSDDDNDGQYTSMYLAMESYRFAATGDPAARERAHQAFQALRFLRTVTGIPGFIARTVIPATWERMHDPNEEIDDRKWAAERVEDPRTKRVGIHWRPSSDGRWLWKTDTSSDEITGHFYGYLMYHELAADEESRREVAEHVSAVMDHIIDGGYMLRDVDGEPTRWGVWAPEKLNHDPLWSPERGINSVEILSYLKTSFHITRNPRYWSEYLRLARDEGYADNARKAKSVNPNVRTHIDDELLALAWHGLFLPADDNDLLPAYREGFQGWRDANKMEMSPFFNFTFASLGPGIDPTLDDSLFFLRDAPLDLVRWKMDNSRREDLTLSRLPEYEHIQTNRLLPPSERGVMRWDENPWVAVQGDGGHTESDGVYWLLPYWMGRYHGYIAPGRAGGS